MKRVVLVAGSFVWCSLVVLGLAHQTLRDTRPGDPGTPPERWPEETRLALDPAGVTLVFLAHPRCPCTPASLEELRTVLETARGPVRAHVLVVRPEGAAPGFGQEGAVWDAARAIPGVVPMLDDQGREAARFGARTSGQVSAWDARGRLLWAGGITAAKGHAGDNAGRRALLAAIAGEQGQQGPVFGCPLDAPASTPSTSTPSPNSERRS